LPYIEFVGPPGCGKTTQVKQLLFRNHNMCPGRRSLFEGRQFRFRSKSIFRELFFATTHLLIFGIVDLWHAIRFFYTTSSSIKTRFRISKYLFFLLLRARLFSISKCTWVVDQGLLQHIQTCLALGFISKNCAKYWCNFFRTSLSYAPDSIKTLRIKPSILVKRILKSEKHINQLNGLTVEDYVEKHVDAYNTLFTSKKTSD